MELDRSELLLLRVTRAIYKKAEKEHLDKERVAEVIKLIQYVFHKDPLKRDEVCWVCLKQG
jgi:hypothetical protein